MPRLGDDVPRLPEELIPDGDLKRISDVVVTEPLMDYARLRWPEETERVQRHKVQRSVYMAVKNRQPHPDDPTRRTLGGPQPVKNRVTKAMGESLIEHFEDRQKEILDAIAAPLAKGADVTPMERHRAGIRIVEAIREEKKDKREADAYERLSDEDVKREMARRMAEAVRNGDLSLDDLIVEGTAVEVPQGQIAS